MEVREIYSLADSTLNFDEISKLELGQEVQILYIVDHEVKEIYIGTFKGDDRWGDYTEAITMTIRGNPGDHELEMKDSYYPAVKFDKRWAWALRYL